MGRNRPAWNSTRSRRGRAPRRRAKQGHCSLGCAPNRVRYSPPPSRCRLRSVARLDLLSTRIAAGAIIAIQANHERVTPHAQFSVDALQVGGDGLGHPQRLRLRGHRLGRAKLLQRPDDRPLRAGQLLPARPLPDGFGGFAVPDSPTEVKNLKAVCASTPFEEELTPPGKGSPFWEQVPVRPSESVSGGLAVVGRTKPEANLEIAEAVVSYRVVK